MTERGEQPTLEQVVTFYTDLFAELRIKHADAESEAQKFFDVQTKNGWLDRDGIPIQFWTSVASRWIQKIKAKLKAGGGDVAKETVMIADCCWKEEQHCECAMYTIRDANEYEFPRDLVKAMTARTAEERAAWEVMNKSRVTHPIPVAKHRDKHWLKNLIKQYAEAYQDRHPQYFERMSAWKQFVDLSATDADMAFLLVYTAWVRYCVTNELLFVNGEEDAEWLEFVSLIPPDKAESWHAMKELYARFKSLKEKRGEA